MWMWLIVAVALLAAELLTGTLALLFAGGGAAVAALIAWMLPGSLATQIFIFALASLIGVGLAWRRLAARQNDGDARVATARGQTVVAATASTVQGELRVRYRGSEWSARLSEPASPVAAETPLFVVAEEGSRLIVSTSPLSSLTEPDHE